jgi:NAD(P)-dependent dehydrogenase (short-subunit alcohol dehydrogenase family)
MATTALITGGTSGISRATANKLAQLGVHTFFPCRDCKPALRPAKPRGIRQTSGNLAGTGSRVAGCFHSGLLVPARPAAVGGDFLFRLRTNLSR